MKPVIVLILTFIIALTAIRILNGVYNITFAGRIAMSSMLIFTSIGHFAFSKGMAMMIPDIIPFKKKLVFLTGVIEIIAAICLLIPALTLLTGWFLIFCFIMLLPANINAAMHHVDYQQGNLKGSGTNYLWFRIPLQLLFIIWVYFSAIKV